MKNVSNTSATLGFTLVEVIVGSVMMILLAISLLKLMIWTQTAAENNLYRTATLGVATSALEQLKNKEIVALNKHVANGNFKFLLSNESEQTLLLGSANVLDIPIRINGAEETSKTIRITLNPSIIRDPSNDRYWFKIEYSHQHPLIDQVYTSTIKYMRSSIERI